MTLQFRPVRAAFVACALVLATLPACDSGPQPGHEAEYWGKKLQEGELTQRDVALTHLVELKSKDSVPFLIEALKGPALELRPRIVEAIAAAGDPSATGALVDAIDWSVGAGRDKESRAAANTNDKVAKALAKLAAANDTKAIEALKRLTGNNNPDVQLSAVFALGELRAVDAVPDLIKVADGHPNNFMVKNAIEALGKIADARAAPVLGRMLFFERGGVSFYREASYALFLVGKDAMPVLDQISANTFAAIDELHIEPNVQKTKALVVYGDLALPATFKRIVDGVDFGENVMADGVLRIEAARAAGRLGLADAVPGLVKRMDNIDISQSEHALAALTQLGRKELVDRIYDISTSAGFLAQCKKAGASEDQCKFSEVQVRKPRLMAFSRLSSDTAKMDKLVADETNEGLKQALADAKARVAAGAECKADVACWTGKLKDQNPRVRERAAYELTWAATGDKGSDAARDALLDALADEDNEARYAAIIGVGRRLPKDGAAVADRIKKQLEAEQGKTQYIRINEDLKRLEVRVRRGY